LSNSNLRFALAANWFAKLASILPDWTPSTDLNQAEDISSAGSSPLPDPQPPIESTLRGKKLMKGKKQMKTKSHIIYAAFALFTFTCFAFLQNAQAIITCDSYPEAIATTTNVTAAGGTSYSFTVTYDSGGIDVSTLDNQDVRISGPGFTSATVLVSVQATANGTIARYSFVPPGGSWGSSDNGTYYVMMQANQVFSNACPVQPGQISSFTVTIGDLGDFNHDGKADYLLYNAGTRQTAVWYLNNNVFIGGAFAPTLPGGWRVIDVADFNRDGKPDYALFNASTRQTAIWYLSGVMFIGGANGPTLPIGWALVAIGDFNNDGKPDYVLYNASIRQTAVWYLNNNVFIGGANGPTLPAGWSLVGVADFNRDGKRDYVLFTPTTHQTAIWYLSGTIRIGGAFGPTIAAGYNLTGAADFNRDGKPDYVLFNPGTRGTAIWYLNNNVRIGAAFGPTLAAGYTLAAP
jgi:hypothetical protein